MKLKDIGEFGFIERIARMGDIRSKGVVKGIGDDCAVMDIGGPEYLLITTDLMVERVHFLRHWASPEAIGAKSLAINLSDIAACGGKPLDAFISLAIPDNAELEWFDGFYRGMRELAEEHAVNLLGGDTTGSKTDLVINIAVTGTVPPEEVLFRHTAKVGDAIVITGPTGDSAAGLDILLLDSPEIPTRIAQRLKEAHLSPRPHIREGRLLAESGSCRAAIDISDGLSSDLGHLCSESGLGAILYKERLPLGEDIARAARIMKRDPMEWVVHGGEAYVLIAAVDGSVLPELQRSAEMIGSLMIPIGEFVKGRDIVMKRPDGSETRIASGGWDHFSDRPHE
jgi:thiamine-monophosphate kinase